MEAKSRKSFKTKNSRSAILTPAIKCMLVAVLFSTCLLNVLFINCLRKLDPEDVQRDLRTMDGTPAAGLVATDEAADTGLANQERYLELELLSSKLNVTLRVNGEKVVDLDKRSRGFNVFALNQATGKVMAARRYDTYESKEEASTMFEFVDSIAEGRIICFAVMDEASSGLKDVRTYEDFKRYGSSYIVRLKYRDMWALITQKVNGKVIAHAEGIETTKDIFQWAAPVLLRTMVATRPDGTIECLHVEGDGNTRRRDFCSKYEGYGKACSCSDPEDITFNPPTFPDGTRLNLPIAVMASNRPQYLHRMLKSLRRAPGVNPEMVTVYIDGFFEQPADVVRLLGLKFIQHEPMSMLNGRIAQHYKRSLSQSFDRFPEAGYLIVLEEDLDVSVDILSYFRQLLPVLENDESVYCISAWNDQGYSHVVNDPSLLYRIETMPGLGWVLSRKLYKGELEAKWPRPQDLWDWDIWMRGSHQRKGRECIIPEISRTLHFGAKGLNVGPAMQKVYFGSHPLNTEPNVKFNVDLLYKDNYEKEINRLLSISDVLDHNKNPCLNPRDFVPDTTGKHYVLFISMVHAVDWTTWNNIARCLNLWDLDVRGFHKDMWRFWIKKNHLMVVGCPASPYCSYKPDNIEPILLVGKETRPPQSFFHE